MPMVKESGYLFDTSEILQLRIVCGYQNQGKLCDGETLYQLGPRLIDLDWRCPRCGEPWRTQFGKNTPGEMRQVSPQESASMALLDALQTLAGPGCAPFTIRSGLGIEARFRSGHSVAGLPPGLPWELTASSVKNLLPITHEV